MRILFFLNNISKARHFDGVIRTLAERGHTIVLAAARQRNRPLSLPKSLTQANHDLIGRGLPGRIELTACPVRRVDRWQRLAPALRQTRDYVRFLDPRYARADKLERRSADHAPEGWPRFVHDHPWVSRHWRAVAGGLALAERAIPTEKLFDLFTAYENPDVVLVTPLVDYGSYQTDYVKSAHRLGVPVVFLPFSWDNLTNRGLVRVEPDRVLVWNDIQRREAIDLHGVSADRVVVTGAPRFDEFFAMRPATSREEFCRGLGLDPAAALVLYVCSSEFVAPREVDLVRRWVAAVRQSADPAVRCASLLIRPHPAHLKQWRDVDMSGSPKVSGYPNYQNVALWTEKETMNADQGLYDSLNHSAAVVGLNTSAMIEAGILGKPVLTLVLDEFAGGQEQTLHFHYLRASNGGLLTEARSLDEHASQLAAAIPVDAAAAVRARRFVERFVRPRGLGSPVTPVMVEEIERAARIVKRPRRPALWQYPVRWGVQALAAGRRFGARSAPKPILPTSQGRGC